MADEIILSHESGAITKVSVHVADDGAAVIEIDTDANFDGQVPVRIWINDYLLHREKV